MTEPLVSVIIPHYNAHAFFGEAISSVYAQGDIVKELIVVDDGSNEESWQYARSFDIQSAPLDQVWIRCSKNHGQGHALNLGVHAATAPYVAFLDADDVWAVGKLRRQLDAFENEPRPTQGIVCGPLVCGHAEEFGAAMGSRKPGPQPARLTSALFAPTDYFEDEMIGPFEEGMGAGMTLEWFSRAELAGFSVLMLKETVYYRRIHGQNYGIVHRERAEREYLDALQLVSDRKKRAADQK